MITLRLDESLEKKIDAAAKSFSISKSELIRRSIAEFLSKNRQNISWATGKDLFGKYSSENENLAKDSEKIFKTKIKSKIQ